MSAPTILITAGEPSGDRLGAALMAELKKLNPAITFIGVGGPQMEGQGLKSAFPMADLAVMGLFEVIPAIPRILGRIKQLTQLARQAQPNLIITIDSQDFSKRLAKSLKFLGVPHIQYVAPKVWAWRQHRVKKLPALYTHLLTILPFEETFFNSIPVTNHQSPVTSFATYVGHPATTTLSAYIQPQSVTTQNATLALLPGSRSSELTRHWPLFLQIYRTLRTLNPRLTAVLALPNQRALTTCQNLAAWGPEDAITPVFGEARFPPLSRATAALSKSGTNNLELALLNIPSVVAYRMNNFTHALLHHLKLVKVPFISLPNLILHYAGQPAVYPEYVQHAATSTNLTAALAPLLLNSPATQTQKQLLTTFQKLMATPKPPAQQAANVVINYLK